MVNQDSSETKENQIFVRNLSYDVTSDDLLHLFEEFGPVKNATVVPAVAVDGDTKSSNRGFGFVKL